MIKTNKFWSYLIVSLFCLSLTSGSFVFAASPAKQLAKGISLYEQNKDNEAMDYFIDVMVSGDKDQVAEANKYVELIHNRMGGIQTPVEVDINFKEGEVKNLEDVTDSAVLAAQQEAEAALVPITFFSAPGFCLVDDALDYLLERRSHFPFDETNCLVYPSVYHEEESLAVPRKHRKLELKPDLFR